MEKEELGLLLFLVLLLGGGFLYTFIKKKEEVPPVPPAPPVKMIELTTTITGRNLKALSGGLERAGYRDFTLEPNYPDELPPPAMIILKTIYSTEADYKLGIAKLNSLLQKLDREIAEPFNWSHSVKLLEQSVAINQ